MTPSGRARLTEAAVAAAFAGTAAALFGEDRTWEFVVAWLALHALYGVASGSFWALVVALGTCAARPRTPSQTKPLRSVADSATAARDG